jgi:hypothetical protein
MYVTMIKYFFLNLTTLWHRDTELLVNYLLFYIMSFIIFHIIVLVCMVYGDCTMCVFFC